MNLLDVTATCNAVLPLPEIERLFFNMEIFVAVINQVIQLKSK